MKRTLEAADNWRYLGMVETTHGSIEIYDVDGVELRFGANESLMEYSAVRAPAWQRASK